jgi:predicted transcriptional regulator
MALRTDDSTFHEMLTLEMARRRKGKASFSLRAFARYLGMPPTTLKFLLDGTRQPNGHSLTKIAERCGWSASEVSRLQSGLAQRRKTVRRKTKEKFFIESDAEALSDILVFALSRLAMIPNQKASVASLAQKLGVKSNRVKLALDALLKRELISVDDGLLKSKGQSLMLTADHDANSVRKMLLQVVDQLQRSLQAGDPEKGRTVCSFVTVGVDGERKLDERLYRYLQPLKRDFPPLENGELYTVLLSVSPFKFHSKGSH